MKRDPLLDHINRIHRHVAWRNRLTVLAVILAAVALALALLGVQ